MKRQVASIFSLLLALSLLIGACNLVTGPTIPTPVLNNPAYTAAAETIIAQLTQVSLPATATPPQADGAEPGETVPAVPDLPTAVDVTDTPLAITEPPAATQVAPTVETPATTEPPAEAAVESTPTATTAPAPASPAGDPKLGLGEPTWWDRFDKGDNWPLVEDEHVQMAADDGRLVMTALQAENWDSWVVAQPRFKNFYVEVTAQPGDCSGLDRYGLLVRGPEANKGYLFGFSCDGKFSLRAWNGQQFTNLIDWTASNAIQAGGGQANRLGLMAQDTKLSLYANGTLLTELRDETFNGRGVFGLFIASENTEGFNVFVDEVNIWRLPE